MKILVTCFEPFGGDDVNASMAVVSALPNILAGMEVNKLTLPVEFGSAADTAKAMAQKIGAELIVSFGEARSRKAVTPELAAINLQYASIPDNAGAKPQDEPIKKDGAAAYFTPFPARKLAEKIRANGVPSTLSYSAGAYVCNDLYYRLLCEFEGNGTQVLFIHVPRCSDCLSYEKMAAAITAAMEECL